MLHQLTIHVMYRLLLLIAICLGASHREKWGEEPDQADIDNGQCIPIKCSLGVPPAECTRLCALRHYLPVCQPPADFCLCQRLRGNSLELVSPDEVLDQPPEPEIRTFTLLTILLPPKGPTQEVPSVPASADPFTGDGYGSINVLEGRLLWNFRYILTGLVLLMVGLVAYELVMCKVQARRDEMDTKWKTINQI